MPRKGWRKNRAPHMAGETIEGASMRLAGNGHKVGLDQVLGYFRGMSVDAMEVTIAAIRATRNLVPRPGRPVTKRVETPQAEV